MGLKKIFLSAGEASGDLHGAGVVAELRKRFPAAKLFGIGGDRMQAAGLELLENSKRLSFMGFAEVLGHLPFLIALRRRVLAAIRERQPDLLVFIDYPGFHFSILRKLARQRGVQKGKVLYYIAPQVWAWKEGRARELARLADHIAVIFPFEVEIFEKHGGRATFVGHPLLDEIGEIPPRGQFLKSLGFEPDDRVVGLFPGSRKQEVKRHLPMLLETARLVQRFEPNVRFVVAQSPTVSDRLYDRYLRDQPQIVRVIGVSHSVLAHANVSLVKSGSTTVEAAYFGNPFVVFYRTSFLSYAIGRRLVKVPYIAMANLLAGTKAVPEFVQHEATPENLFAAAMPLLTVPSEIEDCRARLRLVRAQLGEPGAAKRVAELAAQLLTPK